MKNVNNSPIIRRSKSADPNVLASSLADMSTLISQFSGANDLTKLQAAIDNTPTNGKLVLKQGASYIISGSLNLKSNINIDVNKASIMQTLANTAIFKGIDVSNVSIRRAILNGQGNDFVEADNRLAVGVYVKGSTTTCLNIVIEECEINNCTHAGIYLEKVQRFKVNKNKVTGTGSKDLVAGTNYQFGITPRINCQFGEIIGNEISYTAHGIYGSHEQSDTVIENNDIHDIIGQHGMYLANGTNLKVSKNSVQRVAYQGMKIQLDSNNTVVSKNTIIANNVFDTCGLYGISLENIDTTTLAANRAYFQNVQISNNIISKTTSGGISIRQSKNVKVNNNLVDCDPTSTSYGLYLKNVQNVDVNYNTFTSLGWSGIYFDGDATGVLFPSSDVSITKNIIKEHGQLGSTSHAGLYIINNYTNLVIDGNRVTDKNGLAYKSMYFVDVNSALTARLRNNIFADKGIRFNASITTLLEYDNNDCNDVISFPATIKRGRKATVYNGTIANAPTSSTGYLAGDRYEYTDPTVGGYMGLILIGTTWKPYGAISA